MLVFYADGGGGGGVTWFLYAGVPTQPPNPYPFAYKIDEKDALSVTKFAKTITHLLQTLAKIRTKFVKSMSCLFRKIAIKMNINTVSFTLLLSFLLHFC